MTGFQTCALPIFCNWFRSRGVTDIEPYRLVDEDVEFRLPTELRRELALADEQSA